MVESSTSNPVGIERGPLFRLIATTSERAAFFELLLAGGALEAKLQPSRSRWNMGYIRKIFVFLPRSYSYLLQDGYNLTTAGPRIFKLQSEKTPEPPPNEGSRLKASTFCSASRYYDSFEYLLLMLQ